MIALFILLNVNFITWGSCVKIKKIGINKKELSEINVVSFKSSMIGIKVNWLVIKIDWFLLNGFYQNLINFAISLTH